MTDLHCDNKRCIYFDHESCIAKAVYYLHGICQTVRQRIIVPPPMIDRTLVHDNSSAGSWGRRSRVVRVWR